MRKYRALNLALRIQVVDVDTSTPEPEPEPKKKKGKGGKKKGKKAAAPPPRDFIYVHSNPLKEYFSLLESLQARQNRLTKALAAASDDVDVHPTLLAKVPRTHWNHAFVQISATRTPTAIVRACCRVRLT